MVHVIVDAALQEEKILNHNNPPHTFLMTSFEFFISPRIRFSDILCFSPLTCALPHLVSLVRPAPTNHQLGLGKLGERSPFPQFLDDLRPYI